ncbi:hypothetical protein HDU93_005974 [Gonapodya sp. JEL0774]|nr:hypothetical protein HDU93_005974 [Gonapodya sp. JEL0774]
MNEDNYVLAGQIIKNSGYAKQASESWRSVEKLVKDLLVHKTLPFQGWPDHVIELFLAQLAASDSNNFVGNVGVGEREARVWSDLVRKRNTGFAHGIGRSGNLLEIQPKAFGSSLLQTVTNSLVVDALRIAGYSKRATSAALVYPMATGMTIAMAIRSVAEKRACAKWVVWSRIDQKSAFKAIRVAGEYQEKCDSQSSNLNYWLCSEFNIPHVVNNAYGVQSRRCAGLISEACNVGRLDLFVQSTDKNFMVPVGGACIAGPDEDAVRAVGAMYAGRAGVVQVLDVFITLVGMGKQGWKAVLEERKVGGCRVLLQHK